MINETEPIINSISFDSLEYSFSIPYNINNKEIKNINEINKINL